jgi:PAS domain S-box-containing protein
MIEKLTHKRWSSKVKRARKGAREPCFPAPFLEAAEYNWTENGSWTNKPFDYFSFDANDIFTHHSLSDELTLTCRTINERNKQAKRPLHEVERELAIKNRITDIFITFPGEEMYEKVFEVILQATESKYGIFGYVDENGAMVCPPMARTISGKSGFIDENVIFLNDLGRSRWGQFLMENKTLCFNQPLHVPQTYIPITRVLSVPISFGDEVIGTLTVANKEKDYDGRDRRLLENIARHIAPVLHTRLERDRGELKCKQLEEALKVSENKSQGLFDTIPLAITITNADNGRLVDVNNEFCKQFQCEKEKIMGRSITEMGIFTQKEEELFVQKLRNYGKMSGLEISFKADNGSVRNKVVFAKCIYLVDEACILTAFLDVTERKLLKTQLRQAQKMEAIGILAGGIAHDFNNILSAILGYASLSMMYDIPENNKLKSNLEQVIQAGKRAKELVQQILTFTRWKEEEKKTIHITPVSKEALKLLRASLPSTIEMRQNMGAKNDRVLADPTQIHQVLMNLCTNAAHAMREKGGVLEVSLDNFTLDSGMTTAYPNLNPGTYIRLSVSDTGHGMERELANRIFEPYFTTKENGVGTGLGLAVVNGIVKSYGGGITVRSEPGKGTSFHVYLPVVERKAELKTQTRPLPSKGNEHILIVDDEESLVNINKEVLERLGYKVTTGTSSTKTLEIFQQRPRQFDLVLTDMTMPYMTGIELAGALLEIRADLPIILYSGYNELIDEKEVRAIGIRKFLMKPLVAEDLSQAVREVLDGEQG